ncbi:MAG: tetratricopeptide repeat protein [Wenzhouxiangellaceae bacterium]|nr:tetratricopeptide repeat protein [Wenzhouxiangellaceae bacterium]
MSLWTELKRRNVFRVAAAYVVIGWLMLQVADIVLGFTGAPDWVGKALIAFLVLGFIPVLALAWVFEVGPEGIRIDDGTSQRDAGPQARRLDVLTLGAVVLVVLLMIGQHLGPALLAPESAQESEAAGVAKADSQAAQDKQVEQPPPEPDPWAPPAGSIAALPFTNRSAVQENKYFVDGIHDELLTELARNANLTVISRTSVMEYAETTKNLREIGRELGVANILEGAVQRAGDQVRITAQLIDAATDAHIWAETYDRQLTPENLFAIQTEIASDIATALGRQIAPGSEVAKRTAPTDNAQAYDLFLRARTGSSIGNEASIRQTIDLYRQALEHDPDFALAMGELGLELTDLYWFFTRREDDRDQAREWIDRALDLQPDNPRLRWILARHLYHAELDYDGALAQLALAEQGMPGSAAVYSLRSWIARRSGRIDEYLQAATTAAMLDPRSQDDLGALCVTHAWLGDVESARSWSQRLALIPGVGTYWRFCFERARLQVLGDPESLDRALSEHPLELSTFLERDRLLLPYWHRDFTAARRVIADYPLDLLETQFSLTPKSLLSARVAYAAGDPEATAREATQALEELDAIIAEHPGDYRAMVSRALALALLGRGSEARDWADRALDQPEPGKDVVLKGALSADRLFVLALVADSGELAREFEAYLALPLKFWHFDGLLLDPIFDRHREHPAFKALEEKYSRKAPDA